MSACLVAPWPRCPSPPFLLVQQKGLEVGIHLLLHFPEAIAPHQHWELGHIRKGHLSNALLKTIRRPNQSRIKEQTNYFPETTEPPQLGGLNHYPNAQSF